MSTHFEPTSVEAERAELERVAEAIGRSSRLANLLHYLGEKYFEGDADQLNEYTIATEVFGRSKTAFDASEDAIARVEAHRLRKRLKEFYEGPGKDHPIQISLPPGTYVPSFTRLAPEPSPPAEPAPSTVASANFSASANTPLQKPGADAAQLAPSLMRPRVWLYLLVALAFSTAVVSVFFLNPHSHPASASGSISTSLASPPSEAQSAPATPASDAVRILAGYTGDPQTDGTGAVWIQEKYGDNSSGKG